MGPVVGINNEEIKRRSQYINMRAAQLAAEKQNMPQTLGSTRPSGSRKQLVGTILAIAGVVILLGILAYFRII